MWSIEWYSSVTVCCTGLLQLPVSSDPTCQMQLVCPSSVTHSCASDKPARRSSAWGITRCHVKDSTDNDAICDNLKLTSKCNNCILDFSTVASSHHLNVIIFISCNLWADILIFRNSSMFFCEFTVQSFMAGLVDRFASSSSSYRRMASSCLVITVANSRMPSTTAEWLVSKLLG